MSHITRLIIRSMGCTQLWSHTKYENAKTYHKHTIYMWVRSTIEPRWRLSQGLGLREAIMDTANISMVFVSYTQDSALMPCDDHAKGDSYRAIGDLSPLSKQYCELYAIEYTGHYWEMRKRITHISAFEMCANLIYG